MKRKIATLFKDLCCSACKSDFDENSVTILREEKSAQEEMVVLKLICQECGKSFGIAFLGISDFEFKNDNDENIVLHPQEEAEPITADDVLDAHKFIKKLDKDWKKYIANLD